MTSSRRLVKSELDVLMSKTARGRRSDTFRVVRSHFFVKEGIAETVETAALSILKRAGQCSKTAHSRTTRRHTVALFMLQGTAQSTIIIRIILLILAPWRNSSAVPSAATARPQPARMLILAQRCIMPRWIMSYFRAAPA